MGKRTDDKGEIAQRARYLIRQLWAGFHIGGYVWNKEGDLLWHVGPQSQPLMERLRALWQAGREKRCQAEGDGEAASCCSQCHDSDFLLLEECSGIYFLDLQAGGYIILLGPISGEMMTGAQEARWYAETKGERIKMPFFSLFAKYTLGALALAILTGKQKEPEDLLVQTMSVRQKQAMEADRSNYRLDTVRSGRGRHVTLEEENTYFRVIEEGDVRTATHGVCSQAGVGDVGKMALTSDFKQNEYMAVSAVTLMTRAAMRGGLSPQEAYEISDIFLQRLSIARSVPKLQEIIGEAYARFTVLVHEQKQSRKQSGLVELCCDYIAKHLYRPFTVEQMANELAISRSYLSRRFSGETGESVQRYIRRERLRAAANLLKYSEESIGDIAAYMQFPSAGMFGRYFRETYGQTPGSYRAQHKAREFISQK